MDQKVIDVAESASDIIVGAFKFRSGEKFKPQWQISKERLVELAKILVEQNPGLGTFHKVWIRGTGPDELGICFIYKLGLWDLEHWAKEATSTGSYSDRNYLKKYADFFRKLKFGKAFKGWDVGQGMTELVLEQN